ncbi:hypothetical protein O0S10_07200 [Methanocorpusculum sp. MG]|uniref:Uncharacterized protein n=1 Tax=Methanocorpusculum petauri TaxID=3002863 RepID=A0ABT4IGZ4_9EURY|nr:hypothetical protein [Methanocorpusculum petauri]MCZ0861011.1 hypothetical protein [Methanocorpusculum petauri]
MQHEDTLYQIDSGQTLCVSEPEPPYEQLVSQSNADTLLYLPKQRVNDHLHTYPDAGCRLEVPIIAIDRSELFYLTVTPGKYDFYKVSDQLRVKSTNILLARIDIGSSLVHINPDGERIVGPHLHTYREGYSLRFAQTLENTPFTSPEDPWKTLDEFMNFCTIMKKPEIQRGADQWQQT